jgi:hypothetical protein
VSASSWGLLADAVVVVHLSIVLYAMLGAVVALCGWIAGLGWARNLWFRVSHLAIVLFVAVQAAFDGICPLTTWEDELRTRAEGSFIGRLAHDILFVDVPQATLNVVYIAFAVLVVATWIGCPPRRRRAGGAA